MNDLNENDSTIIFLLSNWFTPSIWEETIHTHICIQTLFTLNIPVALELNQCNILVRSYFCFGSNALRDIIESGQHRAQTVSVQLKLKAISLRTAVLRDQASYRWQIQLELILKVDRNNLGLQLQDGASVIQLLVLARLCFDVHAPWHVLAQRSMCRLQIYLMQRQDILHEKCGVTASSDPPPACCWSRHIALLNNCESAGHKVGKSAKARLNEASALRLPFRAPLSRSREKLFYGRQRDSTTDTACADDT